MLTIAILIGVYSYCVLFIGLIGKLSYFPVFLLTVLLFLIGLLLSISKLRKLDLGALIKYQSKQDLLLYVLFLTLAGVNLIGALGPELAFDSLWYHLTIPKIFILNQKIFYIQGNLFYYSLMPKLTEMFYVSSLLLWSETLAKLIHLTFGILSCVVLFKLARLFLKRTQSLLVVILFYTSPVIMWLSTTAFSDLSRTFFESFSLYQFALYIKKGSRKNLLISAILLGFAIATKILAIGTLFVFIVLIFTLTKDQIREKIKKSLVFSFVALAIPLPWFAMSYFHTGNPFFPLFSELGLRNFTIDLLSPTNFIKTFVGIFLFAPDPISPIYVILLPVVLYGLLFKLRKYLFLMVFCFLTYLIWYFTSQSGGARFLAPFLPAYSLLVYLSVIKLKNAPIFKFVNIVVIVLAISSVLYRGAASFKYVPVIIGVESKEEFLMSHLNFEFGDFYDENSQIKRLVGSDVVLMKNTHNLYYVDFPFTIDEWGNNNYKYVLYQSAEKPEDKGKLVYRNEKTHAWLFRL